MAAPSIVQLQVARSTSAVSSLAATFASTPGVGRLIVAFAFSASDISNVADNKGNTYTQRGADGYDLIWGRYYTAPASTSTATFTVTMTPTASAICTLVIFEVANWNSSTVFEKNGDVWASAADVGAWSPLNFGATSNAEQLFLAGMASQAGFTRTYGAGSGWTLETQYTASDSLALGVISKAVASTGTYDPEFNTSAGGIENIVIGISLIGGTDGPLSGATDLAGSATSGATASAALFVQRNLATAAVAGALASGSLSINRALSGAAIGQAVGVAALQVFSQVWRMPTNAPNGTSVIATVYAGIGGARTIVTQGLAVVAGGYVDLPGNGTPGVKALMHVDNYNDNTATTSIRGGPAIATLTSI